MKKILLPVLWALLLTGICYPGYLTISELSKEYIANSQGRLFLREDKLFYNGSRNDLRCDDIELQEVIDPFSFKVISWQDTWSVNRWVSQDKVMNYELKEELVIFSALPNGKSPGCGWLITIESTDKDVASFIPLNQYYSKDKNSVYFYNGFNKSIEVVWADPETFETIENSSTWKDKNGTYIWGVRWN
jgi:hypothetical protein